MIKSELIAKLAEENPHLTQRDIERVVGVVLERMIQALETGGRVELRGFGALSVLPSLPLSALPPDLPSGFPSTPRISSTKAPAARGRWRSRR